jgi:hypothetical protein
MRRSILAVLLLVATLPTVARSEPASRVQVGYGEADASWRVGTGSGQYTEKDPNVVHLVRGDQADPFNHSWTQRHSYGVQSRLSIRAIVVEGNNGQRAAFVKTDNYLASDALSRRAAQILDAAGTSKIHYEDIMQMASHNHSSPFYYSPSWGVWLFQDVFDIRAFEYEARQMALAIERAAANLRPARMGATKITHTIYKGNIAGATLGDDGTPAGYPDQRAADPVVDNRADFGMTVVRFDEVPSGAPIAVLVNHGQHPESNDDYDLITGDYLAPAERLISRELGTKMVWSQGDVGSSEGPYFRGNNEVLPDGVVRAWAHVGHAQTERGARYLANDIELAYRAIGGELTPQDPPQPPPIVPFTTDFPVIAGHTWVPGPVSHPYPSVSNCRTERTVEGNPGSPILGLPDCFRGDDLEGQIEELTGVNNHTFPLPIPDTVWEQVKSTGAPLSENYDAPAFGGVEENLRLHIQAFRLGEVVFASCACETQMDLVLNFESRANDVTGDIYNGFDYPCTQNPDTTWNCQSGSNLTQTVTISDAKYKRMRAEVNNDAKGWDDPANALSANAEPLDPSQIKGNFTHEELPAQFGYKLPIAVGHAGDYNGYVVSYREYMIRDHYRKALTAYGAHTADYMATRMVRLAGALKGGPAVQPELLDPLAQVDEVREQGFTTALGALSNAVYNAWLAVLPVDMEAEALTQPKNITRFQAATFTWRGGSNATDNPTVAVERLVGSQWETFADQSGEVQTMVQFPEGIPGALDAWTGSHEWSWTANFEAFDAFPRAAVPGGQTPEGTYRFVVDGQVKTDSETVSPYHIVSAPFTVSPWGGHTATDAQRTADSVSFVVAGKYPRTYTSPFSFIHDDGNQTLCKTCSFRPWASLANVTSVLVHIVRGPTSFDAAASLVSGRWVVPVQEGDVVTIQPGGIVDDFGETNAAVIALP